jgi:hypothetical protein
MMGWEITSLTLEDILRILFFKSTQLPKEFREDSIIDLDIELKIQLAGETSQIYFMQSQLLIPHLQLNQN